MIRVTGLTYHYPDTAVPALDNINASIQKGELVLIIGPTGSGKSTFLYCINGLIPHVFGGIVNGGIQVNGLSPSDLPVREISRTTGSVFQNPESQIFMLRVEDDIAFGCENLSMTPEETISRRETALKDMGLEHLRKSETFKLSGGQKQRLAISSIYAMGPEIFLFDEPTTDLDRTGRKEFSGIVQQLKTAGKTILIAEHQYEDLVPLADRVMLFKEGSMDIIAPHNIPHNPLEGGKPRGPASGRTERVVELDHVSFGYQRGTTALHDISLQLHAGELVMVAGENGSGKSTLLKVMAGILKPATGRVVVAGKVNPSVEDLIGITGFLFQNPDEQLFAGTVEDEIMFGPRNFGIRINAEKYLGIADFSSMRERHPQTLSRGQRQLLAVLSILSIEPQIIILDEPATGLDSRTCTILFDMLVTLAEQGKVIIFSSHNANVEKYATRLITIDSGRITTDAVS